MIPICPRFLFVKSMKRSVSIPILHELVTWYRILYWSVYFRKQLVVLWSRNPIPVITGAHLSLCQWPPTKHSACRICRFLQSFAFGGALIGFVFFALCWFIFIFMFTLLLVFDRSNLPGKWVPLLGTPLLGLHDLTEQVILTRRYCKLNR